MRLLLLTLIATTLVAATGCSSTTRCRDVCQREAQCAERRTDDDLFRFDQTECIAACKDLERDGDGIEIVSRHADCVAKAEGCEAVLACP